MATVQTMAQCEQCDTIWAPDELERCYECGTCSERSLERRCEQCNRFMGRADEDGCPECAGECHDVDAVQEADGGWVLAEDYDPDETSAARSNRHADEAKDRARQKQAAFEATLTERTWAEVKAGWMLAQDNPSSYDPDAIWVVRHVTRNPAGAVVVSYTSEHGSMEYAEAHHPDDTVRVASDDESAAEPYGLIVRDPDGADPMADTRSRCTYEVNVGPGTSDTSGMPLLSLQASFGNLSMAVGVWHDPAVAARALDVLAAVATDLAETDGSEPVPEPTVMVGRRVWAELRNVEPTHVAVKMPMYSDRATPVLMMRRSNRIEQVGNGHALLAAIGAARSVLDQLTMTPQ